MRMELQNPFVVESDEAKTASNPCLAYVPAGPRDRLVTKRVLTVEGCVYRLDVHLPSDREAVFVDL